MSAMLTPAQRAKAREFKEIRHGSWDRDGRGRNQPAGFKHKSAPATKPVNS